MERRDKILIIDDVTTNIVQLNTLLGDRYQIFFSTSGADGLAIAVREKPDRVLLDVEMPEMDGYEVCNRLKADPRTAEALVIFVSAHTDAGDEGRGLGLGAVDYIHKPFSAELVRLRVNTQLVLKQQRDQLQMQVVEVSRMFRVAVALIDHAISDGDLAVGEMIERISPSLQWLKRMRRSATAIVDAAAVDDAPQREQLLAEIDEGTVTIGDTLDEIVTTFQDMDRLTQQLNQISGSLLQAEALINDADRIARPEEWQVMYDAMGQTFAMMDAQNLFEAVLRGEPLEEAKRIAREQKRESRDIFEPF